MVKRHSEGQISKDDYERVLESGGDDDDPSSTFTRANEETLKSRKTLSAVRRHQASPSSAAAVASNDDAKANPFAKIDLTKGTFPKDASFSFGIQPPMASTSAPAVTGFSFGQASATPLATAAAPSSSFSFGKSSSSAPALAPSFAFGKAAASASSGGDGADKEAAKLCAKATRAFRETLLGLAPSVTDASIAVKKYMRFDIHQMDKGAKAKNSTTTTTGSSISSKPMMGSSPAAPSAPAAAAAFGGFASTASNKSPAASAGSSSFAFGGGQNSNSISATNPAPGAETADNDTDAIPIVDPADGIQAAVDPDWDDVESYEPIIAYRLKNPEDNESGFAKFATGKMRVQRSTHGLGHRMLIRDKMGLKVLLNMKVSREMKLKWTGENHKRKGVPHGEITFFGTNKEERGYEFIRLLTPVSVGNPLHLKLEEAS